MGPTANEVKQYTMLQDRALMRHRLAMSMPLSEWPKPDRINAEAKRYLARNPDGAFDQALFTNTRLGQALRAKYKTQEAALKALGIDPSVLKDDVVGDKAMRKMGRDDVRDEPRGSADPAAQHEVAADDQSEAVQAFMKFTERLAPDERAEALRLLEACMNEGAEDDELDQEDPRERRQEEMDAEDEPMPFATGGRPTTRGMDPLRADRPFAGHASDAYSEALAASARINVDPYPASDHARRRSVMAMDAITGDAEASWESMFGGGRRKQIGIV
jgi:hypothetical protein